MAPWRASLVLLMCAAAAGCASTRGAVPQPFPRPRAQAGTPPETPPPQAPDEATDTVAVVASALALRGTPYRNGGTDPHGFDCSGFTQYVFAEHGMALPRDVHDQFQSGTPVDRREVAPGDLVFFTTTGPGPTHVGIAIGGGQFVHAPSSTGVVRVERLGTSYWAARYVGARRLIEPPAVALQMP
jgi:cell wall-associated NlpC family hydrolase